jgi:heterodisulfide reductase subunit B
MPISKTTQLKFFEHCQQCGALFPDSLIRIPQMTTAIQKMTEYLNALLYRQGADMDYLDKQFGKPVDEAISDMLHAAECPDCHIQSDGPTHEAKEAASALNSLMSSVRGFVKHFTDSQNPHPLHT